MEAEATNEDSTKEESQQQRAPLSNRRKWFYRVTFAILATIFALLVAENVVAGVAPQPVSYSTPKLNRGAFTAHENTSTPPMT